MIAPLFFTVNFGIAAACFMIARRISERGSAALSRLLESFGFMLTVRSAD